MKDLLHHGCEILVEDPVKILVDPGCENVKKLPGLTLLLSDGGATGFLISSSTTVFASLVPTGEIRYSKKNRDILEMVCSGHSLKLKLI